MLVKTRGTLPSQAKAQRSFQIYDSGIINCIVQPNSLVKGSMNVSGVKKMSIQGGKINQEKNSIQGNNSKITLNPEDSPFKYNIIDTAKRHKTSASINNEKSLIQSKISTQLNNQNQPPISHTNALYFDQLYSPSRMQYIGVKREPKCQKSWFKRLKGMQLKQCPETSQFQIPQDEEERINYHIVERLATNKSRMQSRKWSQSEQKLSRQQIERYSHNGSVNMSRSVREKTKRSQQRELNNTSYLKVISPTTTAHQQILSKSRIPTHSNNNSINGSRLSQSGVKSHHSSLHNKSHLNKSINNELQLQQIYQRTFTISPSKKDYFENMNCQLNNRMVEITTQFQTEMTTSRLNYHNRLRHLRSSSSRIIEQSQSQSQLTDHNTC